MGYCRRVVAQTIPLASLVTKFGGIVPARILQANGGSTTLSAVLVIKFGGGLPAGMLLVHGGADNSFGVLGH